MRLPFDPRHQPSPGSLVAHVDRRGCRLRPPSRCPPGTAATCSLGELKGQVVMVNFWATWCGPCRQEMPLLEQMQTKYEPLGFTLLGINVDRTRGGAGMAAKVPVSFPDPVRPRQRSGRAFGVRHAELGLHRPQRQRALRASRLPARGRNPVRGPDPQPGEGVTSMALVASHAALRRWLALAGCSGVEPWVKPYERQNLADPIMAADRTRSPGATSTTSTRLARARAARSAASGGGCGCN